MLFDELYQQAEALFSITDDPIANAANLSALIFNHSQHINWSGFYFIRDQQLVLGPFQGNPACVIIQLGSGVCGTSALSRQSQCIQDVNQFSGHIACDANSQSEIVIPLFDKHQQLKGVLDIDSDQLAFFDQSDLEGFERLAKLYCLSSKLTDL
ncbi:MAG: GAF domain-containing protein [bacterium]